MINKSVAGFSPVQRYYFCSPFRIVMIKAAFFTTEDFFDRQAGKFVPGFFDFIELSVCMKQVGTLGFLKFNFWGESE